MACGQNAVRSEECRRIGTEWFDGGGAWYRVKSMRMWCSSLLGDPCKQWRHGEGNINNMLLICERRDARRRDTDCIDWHATAEMSVTQCIEDWRVHDAGETNAGELVECRGANYELGAGWSGRRNGMDAGEQSNRDNEHLDVESNTEGGSRTVYFDSSGSVEWVESTYKGGSRLSIHNGTQVIYSSETNDMLPSLLRGAGRCARGHQREEIEDVSAGRRREKLLDWAYNA